jgi:hypothetical protein
MNMKYLRNHLLPKSRALVVGLALTLSVLVVAGFTLLLISPHPVAHAQGNTCDVNGACIKTNIGTTAEFTNRLIDVKATWSCVLPAGGHSSFVGITVTLKQNGGTITASGDYSTKPTCNGVSNEVVVAVLSPAGTGRFQAGQATVSASFSLGYYPNPTFYDLLTVTAPVTQTITIVQPTLRT